MIRPVFFKNYFRIRSMAGAWKTSFWVELWCAGIWSWYIPGMVYTSIYQVYTHPQKLAVGIYQFWGLQLVAHGGLPGGGHRGYKGKFGHMGVPPEV